MDAHKVSMLLETWAEGAEGFCATTSSRFGKRFLPRYCAAAPLLGHAMLSLSTCAASQRRAQVGSAPLDNRRTVQTIWNHIPTPRRWP